MKYLLIIIGLLLIVSCDDCTQYKNQLEHKQFLIDSLTYELLSSQVDSQAICNLCQSNFQAAAKRYWDSIRAEVVNYDDSLKVERDLITDSLNAYFDSIKGTIVKGNMFIRPDHENNVRVYFDGITGKPVLEW